MKTEDKHHPASPPGKDENLGKRLKWARNRLGLSQDDLGKKIKISQTSVDLAERGITVKPKWLPEAATILGVPYDWLVGKSGFQDIIQSTLESRMFIEHIAPSGESIEPAWSIPPAALGLNPASLDGLEIREVIGDAMAPDLRQGDFVVVNTADITPSPAGLFMIHDGHGLQIRRVEPLSSKKLRLSASNPAYSPIESDVSDLTIYGRLVMKMGRV